jgi:hypothetical protein
MRLSSPDPRQEPVKGSCEYGDERSVSLEMFGISLLAEQLLGCREGIGWPGVNIIPTAVIAHPELSAE